MLLFQNLNPRHQTADGCAQLVRRLLRKAHPHLVLLGFLRREQRKNGNDNKQQHHAQLHVRKPREATEHQRILITHVDIIAATVAKINADVAVLGQQFVPESRNAGQTVGARGSAQRKIPEVVHLSPPVQYDDRYRVIVVKNLENQIQIGVVVGLIERPHRLCPYLHPAVFLRLEVISQFARHHKRYHSYKYSHDHQHNLYLPYPVSPFHI